MVLPRVIIENSEHFPRVPSLRLAIDGNSWIVDLRINWPQSRSSVQSQLIVWSQARIFRRFIYRAITLGPLRSV